MLELWTQLVEPWVKDTSRASSAHLSSSGAKSGALPTPEGDPVALFPLHEVLQQEEISDFAPRPEEAETAKAVTAPGPSGQGGSTSAKSGPKVGTSDLRDIKIRGRTAEGTLAVEEVR